MYCIVKDDAIVGIGIARLSQLLLLNTESAGRRQKSFNYY